MGKLFLAYFLFSCISCINAAAQFSISPMSLTNSTELSLDERPPYNKTEIQFELHLEGGVIDITDIPDPT